MVGRRRPFATAILTTAALLMSLASMSPVAAEDSRSTAELGGSASWCADVLVVAARGSGEETGFGGPMGQWVDALKSSLAGTRTARYVALDYPAKAMSVLAGDFLGIYTPAGSSWEYLDSIDAGVDALVEVLSSSERNCPNEKWVVGGYSQGALVVHQALARFTDTKRYAGSRGWSRLRDHCVHRREQRRWRESVRCPVRDFDVHAPGEGAS
ncbi:MAG: cutinase family protein [Aeromicrobium sp.]